MDHVEVLMGDDEVVSIAHNCQGSFSVSHWERLLVLGVPYWESGDFLFEVLFEAVECYVRQEGGDHSSLRGPGGWGGCRSFVENLCFESCSDLPLHHGEGLAFF